jgi:hypothetical protein
MAIKSAVKVLMYCEPHSISGGATNPWRAEIDYGGQVHLSDNGTGGTHTRGALVAATYSALQSAVATALTNAGIT